MSGSTCRYKVTLEADEFCAKSAELDLKPGMVFVIPLAKYRNIPTGSIQHLVLTIDENRNISVPLMW